MNFSNEKTVPFKSLLLVAQGCKKVNNCKIRFRHEMTDEAQPTRDRIVGGSSIYLPVFAKSRQMNSICSQDLILQHSIAGFYLHF